MRKLDWQLKLADASTYPQKGRFYAVDRQVDIRTGAILVKIQFPNPGNILRPGGFGTVSTVVRIQQGALLVPQRAVSEVQGGYLVAVIDHENKVNIRPVKMGQKIGSLWIVEQGLNRGDRIVAEGVQLVQDGTHVAPKPYQAGSSSSQRLTEGSGT